MDFFKNLFCKKSDNIISVINDSIHIDSNDIICIKIDFHNAIYKAKNSNKIINYSYNLLNNNTFKDFNELKLIQSNVTISFNLLKNVLIKAKIVYHFEKIEINKNILIKINKNLTSANNIVQQIHIILCNLLSRIYSTNLINQPYISEIHNIQSPRTILNIPNTPDKDIIDFYNIHFKNHYTITNFIQQN